MQNLDQQVAVAVVDSRTDCYYSTAPFAVETLLACQTPLHYSQHSEQPVVEKWRPQRLPKSLELAKVGFEVADDAFPFGGGRDQVDSHFVASDKAG